MTDSRKPYPLPHLTSDEELAEEFAIFFMTKSKKSGMHLMLILNLNLLNRTPASPLITSLHSKKMKLKKSLCPLYPLCPKSCEFDALPTEVLKEITKPLLPVLTNCQPMVSLSSVHREMEGSNNLSTTKEARTWSDKQKLQAN